MRSLFDALGAQRHGTRGVDGRVQALSAREQYLVAVPGTENARSTTSYILDISRGQWSAMVVASGVKAEQFIAV